ncbi:hypothetical protein [Anaeromyxobacter terrae]|uniref:hypothetical protein n=1 Tax=Anaeromyxobacter terrae TaxID=2925406 RepID=UPI001F5AB4CE|nr:hypothetical protein [Anaeromyxobacter sp. SG22]
MRTTIAASVLAAVLALPAFGGAQEAPAAPPGAASDEARQQEPPPKGADTAAPAGQSDAEKKKLEEDIARELGAAPAKGARPAAGAGEAAGQGGAAVPATGGAAPSDAARYARVLLLPDVSAIGSGAAAFGTYDIGKLSPRTGPFGPADKPAFLFEELELGLQAVVDPYARADAFISFTPSGADVEEAYLTTLSLPAGLQLRAGKLFSPFGRQNAQHPHVWEFVDAPLARGRLLADEVLSGPGVDASWLAPLPWFATLHLAAQSTAPGEGDVAALTGVARLEQFFPFTGTTTLGVGLSAARRDEPGGGAFRDLGGVDLYLRFRPLESRSYLALSGELYARRFRGVPDAPRGTDTGGWAQAFWRQGSYFGYGARYEWAPSAGEAEAGTEQRVAALAAWLPSEFQRIRLQVAYDRRPGGQDGLETLLQLEFGIGAHGAHPF